MKSLLFDRLIDGARGGHETRKIRKRYAMNRKGPACTRAI
jgi:hypothetical protein